MAKIGGLLLIEIAVARCFRDEVTPLLGFTVAVQFREQSFRMMPKLRCRRGVGILQAQALLDHRVKLAQAGRAFPPLLAAEGLDIHYFWSAHNWSARLARLRTQSQMHGGPKTILLRCLMVIPRARPDSMQQGDRCGKH